MNINIGTVQCDYCCYFKTNQLKFNLVLWTKKVFEYCSIGWTCKSKTWVCYFYEIYFVDRMCSSLLDNFRLWNYFVWKKDRVRTWWVLHSSHRVDQSKSVRFGKQLVCVLHEKSVCGNIHWNNNNNYDYTGNNDTDNDTKNTDTSNNDTDNNDTDNNGTDNNDNKNTDNIYWRGMSTLDFTRLISW